MPAAQGVGLQIRSSNHREVGAGDQAWFDRKITLGGSDAYFYVRTTFSPAR
jgi:hypothetical protein